ncbi:MAG TPA: DUF2231 domain-containing protein [Polyangiales bacterium]|nr:DUF2231 domain-containing protein [Polyangiales bacterium]
MESRAKVLGHPVHQMLIPIPAGLFIVAAVLDIVDTFVDAAWISTVTYWNIAFGVISALVAAVFGAIDWTKIPRDTRAKRVGAIHGIGNVIAVLFFGCALLMRSDNAMYATDSGALALEVIAFLMLGVTAWLGGELVDRMGVGVDDGANLNAPSSLREKHVPTSMHH